jgi:hypothetical protein
LNDDSDEEECFGHLQGHGGSDDNSDTIPAFPNGISQPARKHKDKNKPLKFTIWTSRECYEGTPRKEFNSSFNTLEEANQRVQYVFWFMNPWGYGTEEMHADRNKCDKNGFLRMEVYPEQWTVSAIPSEAFQYLNRYQNIGENYHWHDDVNDGSRFREDGQDPVFIF